MKLYKFNSEDQITKFQNSPSPTKIKVMEHKMARVSVYLVTWGLPEDMNDVVAQLLVLSLAM